MAFTEEDWGDIPPAARPLILKKGGFLWAQAVSRMEIRKTALQLAVAAVGPTGAENVERAADSFTRWLEQDKPKLDFEESAANDGQR